MRGITKESAKSFFDHHQNNSLWVNQFNRLIDWRSKLVTWAANDRKIKTTNENRTTSSKAKPGNAGVTIGPSDYGAAKPRAQREREAKGLD